MIAGICSSYCLQYWIFVLTVNWTMKFTSFSLVGFGGVDYFFFHLFAANMTISHLLLLLKITDGPDSLEFADIGISRIFVCLKIQTFFFLDFIRGADSVFLIIFFHAVPFLKIVPKS